MKFIFVSSSFNIGGVATSFSTLVDFAINKNDEVELHVIDQKAENKAYIPERVKIVYVQSDYKNIYGQGAKKGVIFLYRKYGLWAAMKRLFVRVLKEIGIHRPFILNKEFFDNSAHSKCDVCLILQENDPCLFYAINNIESQKKVVFFHTAGYLRGEYKPIYSSRIIDEIVTVSKGNRDFLVENMPKAAHKIHVIHNIVPVNKIKSLAQSSQKLFTEEELPILFAGRICEEKGIGAIIKAAILLKSQIPNIHWYLLGRFDGKLTSEQFDKLLIENGIQEQVTVLPAIKNPYPYIAQSWVIINPSRYESFGMVIRESQILGKPVIATRTYGGIELIEDRKTGLLVDIDDSLQMSEMIKKLYYDADFYNEIVTTLNNKDFDESGFVKKQFNSCVRILS